MNALTIQLRMSVLGILIGFASCKPVNQANGTPPVSQADAITAVSQADVSAPDVTPPVSKADAKIPVGQADPRMPVSQADAPTQHCMTTFLSALTADDYDQFVSVAEDKFAKRLTPTAFHSFSQSVAPRMQGGCTPTYLGQLRQKGVQVSVWRLAFADGGDDLLARMTIAKDRISGFLMTPAFQ
jgi:hypothetical protein